MGEPSVSGDGLYDLVVIGGGPAGATAGLYGARAGLRTLVVDKGLRSGALGLAQRIANYPGAGGELSGAELLERMRDQARSQGAEFAQGKVVASMLREGAHELLIGDGSYRGRAMVIATGSMGRAPSVAGEEEFVGKGVGYCATCDAAFFRDKTVAVVGDSDEAGEETLLLAKLAGQVHLVVPGKEAKMDSDLLAQVESHPLVDVHMATSLRQISGGEQVEKVRLRPPGGEEYELSVAGVFIYLQGARPAVDFLGGQLELDEKGHISVDEWFSASAPGVFAAGDVIGPRVRQVVVAAAQGAQAAMAAERYLSGRAGIRPDWS